MKKIEPGSIITAIANVGVIIGIVFLVVEIRQSNQIATASTEIEIRTLFSGINEAFYAAPGMARILVKAQDRGEQLTPEEETQLHGLVWRLANAWQALEVAYDNNLVPSDTATIIEDDVKAFISDYPLSAPIFRQMIETYPGQESRRVSQAILKALEETED
jgi:hypothetical protein